MTEDQKRADKAALLLEYEEGKQELAALRERANQTAASLNKLATFLREPERVVLEANLVMPSPGIARPLGLNPNDYPAISGAEVLALCRDIREAQKNVDGLQARKHALGLS